MSNICFKTRGTSSPQGKPRVYFTAHPNDYDVFLDEIVQDILKTQNCTVYYDSEPSADYSEEDLCETLREMQLIVVAVTSLFLCEPNRAREVELDIAEKYKIPVLPIMIEDGLENLFNRLCGNRQLLSKTTKEETTLSYEEKLAKYLNTILVGNELAEQVRKAFDAYIFLSYRKKDRRYAQELMKLIHQNDFCRDIAIWYDEFLVPGEDFNDHILSALNKSKLFVLTVTPNVINETNYVMTTEYPLAIEHHKPVLPVEMTDTDRGLLKERYKDIPSCINKNDTLSLSAALADKLGKELKRIAVVENDSDPVHNFFIGLAYLNGIDVETDTERALFLIQTAADAGLTQAVETLISMYETGNGVEQNDDTAFMYRKKLIALYQEAYRTAPSDETLENLVSAHMDAGDRYIQLKRETEAASSYEKASNVLSETVSETKTTLKYTALYYRNRAKLFEMQGNSKESESLYLKSLALGKQFADKSSSENVCQKDLEFVLDLHVDISGFYSDIGKLNAAAKYAEDGLQMLKTRGIDNTDKRHRMESVFLETLGSYYTNLGDKTRARKFYKHAANLSKCNYEEEHSTKNALRYVIALQKLGEIIQSEERVGNCNFKTDSDAERTYRTAMEICAEYICETTDISMKIQYGQLLRLLASLKNEQGEGNASINTQRWNEAETYLLDALSLFQQLEQERSTIEIKRHLYLSHYHLAAFYLNRYDGEKAKPHYLLAKEIAEDVARINDTPQVSTELSQIFSGLSSADKWINISENGKKHKEKQEQLKEEYGEAEADLWSILYSLALESSPTPKQDELFFGFKIPWTSYNQYNAEDPEMRLKSYEAAKEKALESELLADLKTYADATEMMGEINYYNEKFDLAWNYFLEYNDVVRHCLSINPDSFISKDLCRRHLIDTAIARQDEVALRELGLQDLLSSWQCALQECDAFNQYSIDALATNAKNYGQFLDKEADRINCWLYAYFHLRNDEWWDEDDFQMVNTPLSKLGINIKNVNEEEFLQKITEEARLSRNSSLLGEKKYALALCKLCDYSLKLHQKTDETHRLCEEYAHVRANIATAEYTVTNRLLLIRAYVRAAQAHPQKVYGCLRYATAIHDFKKLIEETRNTFWQSEVDKIENMRQELFNS